MNRFNIFSNELVKYEGNEKHVVIPETITSIKDFAFYGCEQLESITIPQSVTSIGNFVFYGCDQLKSITLPQTVKLIGGGVFSYCRNLETVIINSPIITLAKSMFYHCPELKEVILPHTLITIEHNTFGFCSALSHIEFPDSLRSIGHHAFEECVSLNHIEFPKHLESIGEKAFHKCTGLRYVKISASVLEIGKYAFETFAPLSFISHPTLFIKPEVFDSRSHLSFTKPGAIEYPLVNSYLPNIEIEEWKEDARIIVLVNFLETYDLHQDKDPYKKWCQEYKILLIKYLIKHKRYDALNQALEVNILTSQDIHPYFDQIIDREQKAKVMEYKGKENKKSSLNDLEDELLNMF